MLIKLPPPPFLPLPCTCTCRHSSSRSSSSSTYLSRQSRDPYVKSALANSYVSRAAFKLLELDEKYSLQRTKGKGKEKVTGGGKRRGLIDGNMNVVDLGAAPGGWTQVANELMDRRPSKSRRNPSSGRIFALDLLPLKQDVASLPRVQFLQGDFSDPAIQAKLLASLPSKSGGETGGGVDLILSDLLPNLTGTSTTDSSLSYTLNTSVLDFARQTLSPTKSEDEDDGTDSDRPQLVIKHLTSALTEEFKKDLRDLFKVVRWEKPKSSRKESREGFWVCSGFKGREGGNASEDGGEVKEQEKEGSGLYF